jgi:hypothetical protein
MLAASVLTWFKDLGIPTLIGVALGFGLNQWAAKRERVRSSRQRLREREGTAAEALDAALAEIWDAQKLGSGETILDAHVFEEVRTAWDAAWTLHSPYVRSPEVRDPLEALNALIRQIRDLGLVSGPSLADVGPRTAYELLMALGLAIINAREAISAFLYSEPPPPPSFPTAQDVEVLILTGPRNAPGRKLAQWFEEHRNDTEALDHAVGVYVLAGKGLPDLADPSPA